MTRVATTANEFVLLEEARLTTGQQLETICRKYAMVQRHGAEANLDDDRERRHVTRSDTSNGMVRIAAVLHPEEAAMVWAALERIVKEGHRGVRPVRDASPGSVSSEEARVPPGTFNNKDGVRLDAAAARFATGAREDGDGLGDCPADEISEARVPAGTSCAQGRQANLGMKGGESLAEPPKHAQRFSRADALVTMAQEILRGTRSDRSPTELVVTVPVDRLAADQSPPLGRRVLRDGRRSRSMSCDARLRCWHRGGGRGRRQPLSSAADAHDSGIDEAGVARRDQGADSGIQHRRSSRVTTWSTGPMAARQLANLVLCAATITVSSTSRYQITIEITRSRLSIRAAG